MKALFLTDIYFKLLLDYVFCYFLYYKCMIDEFFHNDKLYIYVYYILCFQYVEFFNKKNFFVMILKE